MIEWLREFFFNAGVFKGTVRMVLIGSGVAAAALPREILGDAPSWIRIAGVISVAIGAFIRSTSQTRDEEKEAVQEKEETEEKEGETTA